MDGRRRLDDAELDRIAAGAGKPCFGQCPPPQGSGPGLELQDGHDENQLCDEDRLSELDPGNP